MPGTVAQHAPDARVTGFTVQPMVARPGAFELILGIVDDGTFGPVLLKGLRGVTDAVFDVHLMIQNPAEQIDLYAEAGADNILFHQEVDPRPVRLLNRIRSLGKKSGIVYNPATPLE